MIKKILFSIASFLYTLLYVLAWDVDIFITDFLFHFSEDGTVLWSQIESMVLLLNVILSGGLIVFVIFQFDRIKGFFIWIYLSSLLASFLMPIFFSSLNEPGFLGVFPWYLTGTVQVLSNALVGPAMFFLLSYFAVKLLKNKHTNECKQHTK